VSKDGSVGRLVAGWSHPLPLARFWNAHFSCFLRDFAAQKYPPRKPKRVFVYTKVEAE
jgi:hypothetical protein